MVSETYLRFIPDLQDPSWGPEWVPQVAGDQPRELAALTQSAFLWYNFLTSSVFKVGGADFSITSPTFSVLDHVLMLSAARTIVRKSGHASLDLSDRAGEWHFARNGEQIVVHTSGYGHRDQGVCAADTFESLVDQSLVDALALIFDAQPALRKNSYLQGLAKEAAITGRTPSA